METYLKTKDKEEAEELVKLLQTLDPGTKMYLLGLIQGTKMSQSIDPDPNGEKKTA